MLRLDDLLDLRNYLSARSTEPWDDIPSDDSIAACLREADDLVGRLVSPSDELAALFFALSRDEGRLGDARFQMPVRAAYAQLHASGMQLSRAGHDRLRDLQDEIAAGMNWADVQRWFGEHVIGRR
ncbi:MAG TPA: hypothetical protein VLS89_07975 [Candidatus Nanopelagicales bacterium]|nr:hypothetical protein [Candidatus Nanopelagicales bacterium]